MKSVLLSSRIKLDGKQKLAKMKLPANTRYITYRLARCTPDTPELWPSLETKIKVRLKVSYDGGKIWHKGGALKTVGGAWLKDGRALSETDMRFEYPMAPTHIWGIRGITNGPLDTIETIEAS